MHVHMRARTHTHAHTHECTQFLSNAHTCARTYTHTNAYARTHAVQMPSHHSYFKRGERCRDQTEQHDTLYQVNPECPSRPTTRIHQCCAGWTWLMKQKIKNHSLILHINPIFPIRGDTVNVPGMDWLVVLGFVQIAGLQCYSK